MIRLRLSRLLLVAVLLPSPLAAATDPQALANDMLNVLQVRCASCHGPHLVKPKGKFGHVTDLRRLATDAKLVVPGKPERSKLWELVRDNEMPPDDADTGPVSEPERQLLRRWIEAGAPAVSGTTQPTTRAREASPVRRGLRLLGRMHILLVHYPVALITVGLLAEGLWLLGRRAWLGEAARFCVLAGAIGAVLAATTGWVDAYFRVATADQLLSWHRWLGTGAAACALVLAVLWRPRHRWAMRAALVLAVAMTVAAAHYGGMLAHGVDYFAGG